MRHSFKKYGYWCLALVGMTFLQAQTPSNEKPDAMENSATTAAEVKALVASGKFSFEADRAFAIGGSSFSVVNISNYVKVNEGTAEGMLPFFGERRSGNGVTDAGEIRFNGAIDKYKVKHKAKKNSFVVSFITRNTSERFDITIMVNHTGWATLIVKSIDRNSISYHGKLEPLKED